MRIRYLSVDTLPPGADAGLLEGDGVVYVYLASGATVEQLAEALTDLMDGWASEKWLFVGNCGADVQRLREAG